MRLLILLVAFPTLLTAQLTFLKDPDIVWAAEIVQDWVIDTPSLETEWGQGLTTLKVLRVAQNWEYNVQTNDVPMSDTPLIYVTKEVHTRYKSPSLSSPYLADLVYMAALRGKLPVFKDVNCTIPFSPSGEPRDTIVTFDPLTQQEIIKTIFNELDPINNFKAWRLRQIIAYHKKSATWTITLGAIAPLTEQWDHLGDSVVVRPFFWFRPDDKPQKLSNDDIVWAKPPEIYSPTPRC